MNLNADLPKIIEKFAERKQTYPGTHPIPPRSICIYSFQPFCMRNTSKNADRHSGEDKKTRGYLTTGFLQNPGSGRGDDENKISNRKSVSKLRKSCDCKG